jgi:hypothetical protein
MPFHHPDIGCPDEEPLIKVWCGPYLLLVPTKPDHPIPKIGQSDLYCFQLLSDLCANTFW